jgi:tetratricopeptide (TPR) repeat protein
MSKVIIVVAVTIVTLIISATSWAIPPKAALDAEKSGDNFFSSKNYAQAIEMYSQALKIDPEFMRIPPKLGILYVLTKDYPKAEQMFETAVRSNPKDALITSNYASVLLLNDKLEEAVGAAKLSLQIKPDPKTYMTLGQAYARLKKNDMASIAFEKGILLGGDDPEVLARLQESKSDSRD